METLDLDVIEDELESDPTQQMHNLWPHLSHYFKYKSKLKENLIYECQLCLPQKKTVNAHITSLNNLKQHVKRNHSAKYVEFEEKVRAVSTRGKKRPQPQSSNNTSLSQSPSTSKKIRQQSIGESLSNAPSSFRSTQAIVDQCIIKFFVDNMIPLSAVESNSFEQLIKVLNPNKNSMSRRTLGRRIIEAHDDLKQHLIKILEKIKWVATTADCWSAHNKSYLGMTIHWLNPNTRERMRAMLACIRIRGHHTYDVLAQAINNIHYEFRIEEKVIRTTTDSASNFVKAFVQYGIQNEQLPNTSSAYEPSCEPQDAVTALLEDCEEESDVEYISLENLLSPDSDVVTQETFISLPTHMRCAAHQYNLVATKGTEAAVKIHSFKNAYAASMGKARAVWNLQSHSTIVADRVQSELGRKLVVPNTTRWNSTYDAVVVLIEILETKRPDLHRAMSHKNLAHFSEQDVTVLKEYVKVMSPVAMALDIIQGESQAYLGTLLPTVASTILKLKDVKSSGLTYCSALVNALLDEIDKRFGYLMVDEECQLAAAFHPKFRIFWLEKYDKTMVRLVQDCMEAKIKAALHEECSTTEQENITESSHTKEKEDDFFSAVTQAEEISASNISLDHKSRNLVATWLSSQSKNSFSDADFLNEQVLIRLFLKYNTPIPSSAAVERLFSTGKDILRPKRSSLSDENFNILMFMKRNFHIKNYT